MVKIENRRIVIRTMDEEITGTLLEQVERVLQPFGFVKIDQSKLVDIFKADKLNGNTLTFLNTELTCQVSRRNIRNVNYKIRQKQT